MENKVPQNYPADANKKIEAIIRAVAVKHGIALGRNDPILMLHTVNSLLMDEFAQQQDILIDQFRINLEASADQWSKNMDAKGNDILSQMEHIQSKQIKNLMEKQIEDMAFFISEKYGDIADTQLRRTLRNLKSLNSQIKAMSLFFYINLAASLMALISAILILWLLIK